MDAMHQLLEAARTTLGVDAACLFETGEHGELLRACAGSLDESAAATRFEAPVRRSDDEPRWVLRCLALEPRPGPTASELELLRVFARAAALELEERGRAQAESEHQALIAVSAAVAAVHSLDEVLEVAAEEIRRALRAASVSISRWDREADLLHTLINVGELGPGEQRRPTDENYGLEDFPRSRRLLERQESYIVTVDDATVPADQRVLQSLGKDSALAVPIVYDGRSWGELEVFSAPGAPRFTSSSVRFAEAISLQLSTAIGRAELFSRISELALSDPLTGLANRRAIDQRLEEAIERAVERENELSVLFFDLDDLKAINDAGGHDAGDEALKRVATALRSAAQRYPGSFVGRVGGDEFCVVLEGEAVERAKELALEVQGLLAEAESAISLSAGASALTGPETRPADLYRAADAAQYAAKRAGRGHVFVAGSGEVAEQLDERPGRPRRRRFRDEC
jgi:diguanylate cyclase (GGDEF)-like protein